MERLQRAGVPAAMMMRPDDHDADPHLRTRGLGAALDQPGLGTVRVEQGPFRSREDPPVRVAPAPEHGEHTREICATLLGLSAGEIDALFAAGVLEEPLPGERWRHDRDRDRRPRPDRDGQGLRAHGHGLRGRGARARARRRRAREVTTSTAC